MWGQQLKSSGKQFNVQFDCGVENATFERLSLKVVKVHVLK